MDRVTRVIDRAGQAATLTYDALGDLASVTDPTGIATQDPATTRAVGSMRLRAVAIRGNLAMMMKAS